MQVIVRLSALIVCVLLAHANESLACFAGSRDPESLVRDAEIIVRVRASSSEVVTRPDRFGEAESLVRFIVLDQIKGPHQFDLVVRGKLSENADMNPGRVPYTFIRRGGRGGNCYAEAYQADGEFLILLKTVDGALSPYWAPLSVTNEQITGARDEWLVWVKEQVARGAQPKPRPMFPVRYEKKQAFSFSR